jgi:ferritin
MLKKNVEEALNKQVNRELFSSMLYLSMAAWFESKTLKGFAKWMMVQAEEEKGHAMKIYEYIVEAGGRARFDAIEAPKGDWKSPLDVFSHAYEHEKKVTGLINALVELTLKEKDHATHNMLLWFVKEQVEEEAQTLEIVEKLKMIGDMTPLLLPFDHELGKRE